MNRPSESTSETSEFRARRALLRAAVYVPPAIIGTLLISRDAIAGPSGCGPCSDPACNPCVCVKRPGCNPCSKGTAPNQLPRCLPAECAPASCPPNICLPASPPTKAP